MDEVDLTLRERFPNENDRLELFKKDYDNFLNNYKQDN